MNRQFKGHPNRAVDYVHDVEGFLVGAKHELRGWGGQQPKLSQAMICLGAAKLALAMAMEYIETGVDHWDAKKIAGTTSARRRTRAPQTEKESK